MKQKSRSLWWLLLAPVPYWIGCAVWLALKDKTQAAASWTLTAADASGSLGMERSADQPHHDAERDEQTRCPNCGMEVPEHSKFCLECGRGLCVGDEPDTGDAAEAAPGSLEVGVNAGLNALKNIVAVLLALLLLFIFVAVVINKLS